MKKWAKADSLFVDDDLQKQIQTLVDALENGGIKEEIYRGLGRRYLKHRSRTTVGQFRWRLVAAKMVDTRISEIMRIISCEKALREFLAGLGITASLALARGKQQRPSGGKQVTIGYAGREGIRRRVERVVKLMSRLGGQGAAGTVKIDCGLFVLRLRVWKLAGQNTITPS